MDLSQQELPLTSYFSKGKKENKPVTDSSKKRKLDTADTAARPCKRGKEEVLKDLQSAVRNASRKSTGRSSAFLPTPAASARKRVPSTRGAQSGSSNLQSSAKRTGKTGTTHASTLSDVIDLTHTDAEDTPFKALPKARRGKSDEGVAVAQTIVTPSSHTGPHVRDIQQIPPVRLPEVALPTPATGLRKAPAGVSESPSAARSRFSRLTVALRRSSSPSLPSQALAALKFSVPTVDKIARSRGNSDNITALHEPDPFCAQVEPDGAVNTDVPHESQHRMIRRRSMSELRTSEISHVPMQPVPSSQSQYLLHIDATPKRRRIATRRGSVPSSQILEERELDMSRLPSLVPESVLRKDIDDGSSKSNGLETSNMLAPAAHSAPHTPRRTGHRCVNWHTHTLGSSPLTSAVPSPNGPNRSFLVTRLAVEKASLKLAHHEGKGSPYRSSTHKTRSPHCRKLIREDSVKGAPPVAEDDSETEPESSPSRNIPSKVPCKRAGGRPADDVSLVPGEDSVTEPESDTDILHCVAAIGKKRAQQVHAPAVPPVGSSRGVKSTVKSQSAQSASSSAQSLTQEGPSLPTTHALRVFDRTRLPGSTDSIPSVVREFMHMFQGDGSYPDDFPESLRT